MAFDPMNTVLVDAWPKRVTVGASALLSASVTFPAGTARVALVPHDPTIPVYVYKTTATANTCIIPTGGISFAGEKTVLDALAVYSASAAYVDVWLFS